MSLEQLNKNNYISACPSCGCKQYTIVFKDARELYNNIGDAFDVVKCNLCALIYTNPRPTPQSMHAYYPESAGYYQPIPECDAGLMRKLLDKVLQRHLGYNSPSSIPSVAADFVWLFGKRVIDIMHIPPYVPEGRLLDFGCSWGNYLCRMRRLGWDVSGIEWSDSPAKYARDTLGLDVRTGGAEILDSFSNNEFNVINMNMVLEHLYDPIDTLIQVQSKMKRDGILMLAVPDFSGFEFRIFKEYCYALQVPQHLVHYTPKTISDVLSKANFKTVKIIHHAADRDIVASAFEHPTYKVFYPILKNKIFRKFIVKNVSRMLSLFGLTSRMSIYATPINS